jgi:hypothetical protein
VEPSEIEVPDDHLEFARTAAGFWHSSLFAPARGPGGGRRGQRRRDARPAAHRARHRRDRAPGGRALPALAAGCSIPRWRARLGRMMELTTKVGTARSAFQDRRGRPYLPVDVAGKTGTLFYRGHPEDPPRPPPSCPTAASSATAGSSATPRPRSRASPSRWSSEPAGVEDQGHLRGPPDRGRVFVPSARGRGSGRQAGWERPSTGPQDSSSCTGYLA